MCSIRQFVCDRAPAQAEDDIFTTTTDTAGAICLPPTMSPTGSTSRDIDATNLIGAMDQSDSFPSVPANAFSWNLNRVDFYGRKSSVRNRRRWPCNSAPRAIPTTSRPATCLVRSAFPNRRSSTRFRNISTAFPTPIRELVVQPQVRMSCWSQSGGGSAARIAYADTGFTGVVESDRRRRFLAVQAGAADVLPSSTARTRRPARPTT